MDSHRGRPNGTGVVWPSAKTVYALRACAALAAAYPQRRLKSSEIASASGAPRRFLSKILNELRVAQVLSAKRGYDGGYALVRDPRSISLAELMRALNGYELFVPLAADRRPGLNIIDDLRDALSRTASDTLRNTSIADLAEQLDQAAPA
jgi:Rrf2 family protein